jgi:hypothetical protein
MNGDSNPDARNKGVAMRLRIHCRSARRTILPLLDKGVSVRQVTAVLLAVVLAFLVVPVGALAQPPAPKVFITDPGNNDNIAHVDGAGNLQVTGSLNVGNTPTVKAQQDGTWNVGITGTPTVDVGNFPAPQTQNVNVVGPPQKVTFVEPISYVDVGPGDTRAVNFNLTIDTTSVIIAKGNDDVKVDLSRPGGLPDVVMAIDDTGVQPVFTYTFPNPIPFSGATVWCENVNFACTEIDITLAGFRES